MTQDELSAIFQNYFEPVYRYVYFRIGHKHETEDLISTIFEKVVGHSESYSHRESASLKSWVFRIAHNTVVDYYRTKKPVEDITNVEIITQSSIEKDFDMSIDMTRVRALINKLPERKREILLLRYQAQLTYEEIAQLLNIEPKSASSLLSKALKEVQAQYNAQFGNL